MTIDGGAHHDVIGNESKKPVTKDGVGSASVCMVGTCATTRIGCEREVACCCVVDPKTIDTH